MVRTFCGLGEIIDRANDPEEVKRFAEGYVRYQRAFASGDELGSSVDEGVAAVEVVCDVLGLDNFGDFVSAADALVQCIESRYLGNCITDGCAGSIALQNFFADESVTSVGVRQ